MLNVTKVNKNSENIVKEMLSDSLHEFYNFMNNNESLTILLLDNDINSFYKKEFHNLSKEKINLIFYLCETCDHDDDLSFNFKIHETGEIVIGLTMGYIKKDIEKFKEAYNKFLNREFYNIIEFSIQ